jgi:hypothetical protein
MSDDRRTSVRRQAALPFEWCPLPEDAGTADALRALGLPAPLTLQSRLAELDEEFRRSCSALADPRTVEALRALDGKLSGLEEALFSALPAPAPRAVTVSADGLGFSNGEALPVGGQLALHLVLPVSQHVVGVGRIRHCVAGPDRFAIGVELLGLDAQSARRLTRYAIGGGRDPAGAASGRDG